MNLTDFTGNTTVCKLIDSLRNEGIHLRQFSDVMDNQGNQYVELVQEGGGVLGIALTGYTWVLEQMGLRFAGLAGTSAGSINALMLAALGDISQPKSERIIAELARKNLFDLMDGTTDARAFIRALTGKTRRIILAWKAWQIVDDLYEHLGLNPGDEFTRWITGFLISQGIRTWDDLHQKFAALPSGLSIREGVNQSVEGILPRLAIIAADITTGTKAEFPAMAELYWSDPAKVNPALFVRASVAVPYFFRPLRIGSVPRGENAVAKWKSLAAYSGPIPRQVYLVDGGTMSNFPVNVFHQYGSVPRMPTFGVRLGDDRNSTNHISNPLNLFGSLFNSVRNLHDYDFILKHPDYSMLIGKIDVGHHGWLDFSLSDDAKLDLFIRGAQGAARFLESFNWKDYKQVREKLIYKPVDRQSQATMERFYPSSTKS